MNVRIYSVHIEGFKEGDGWTNWDVVNVVLTNDAHAVPEAIVLGLELCCKDIEGTKPDSLRVHEVRFIAEGQTA